MNKEEFKELARQEFINNVMTNFNSSLIFTYISNLEQENKQLKEQLGKLSKLDDTDFWLEYNRDVWKIQNENERLLELCMYSLISNTSIYKHELANDIKQSFMKIIKDNIDLDTFSIREKIKKCWGDSNE